MKCVLCDNDNIKCASKRVVYKITCEPCLIKTQFEEGNLKSGYSYTSHYIGETSRPWRCRILEHVQALESRDPKSFAVRHLALSHGTTTVAPKFSFHKVISHIDPLSRQLKEAILIRDEGNMNRKDEFSNNEIIRLESNGYTWDRENKRKQEAKYEMRLRQDIRAFTEMLENVINVSKNTISHDVPDINKKKHLITDQAVNCISKKRRMEARTPVKTATYRINSPEHSPISGDESSTVSTLGSSFGEASSMGVRKQVNDSVHKAMMNVKISLPEMNNKLRELAQLMVEANTHMDTATTVGVIADRKRSLSCGGNPISGSRTNSDDDKRSQSVTDLFHAMGIREDEHNHKHFEESDIDAGELEAEIGKISRNCLYDVFSSIIDTLEESGVLISEHYQA